MVPLLVVLALTGCTFSTAPNGPFADLRGTWTFTGQQTAPALQLSGTLVVGSQQGDLVSGQLSFEEHDGVGTTLRAGPITGRAIDTTDVDFDLLLSNGERRHIGRISSNQDTLQGLWVQMATGTEGVFLAIRTAP